MRTIAAIAILALLPAVADAQYFSRTTVASRTDTTVVEDPPVVPVVAATCPALFTANVAYATPFVGYGGYGFSRFNAFGGYGGFGRFNTFGGYGVGFNRFAVGYGGFGGARFFGGFASRSVVVGPHGGVAVSRVRFH